MAYAVLSSLAQTIHQILDSDPYPISDNGKHQITSLRENVVFLQEFLEKFPKEATSLEIRIRNAVNEAEDILEHFVDDQIRLIRSAMNELIKLSEIISGSTTNNPSDYFDELKKVMMEINSNRNVKSLNTTENEVRELIENIFGSTTNNPSYDFDQLQEVMVEINSICQNAADVKSLNTTENAVVGDNPPTVRYAVGGVTVGLDDDVLKIKDLLARGSSDLHTIPIEGMGGIGKTTLAMIAYNDPLIMETFTVRAWVTVSQEYKAENIFSVLVDSFKELGDVTSGVIAMEKVYKFLFGRRYLIVLDDIWSMQAWDDVKTAFPDRGDGSRIILTTRSRDVASHASSLNYIHVMSFMDEYRSWDLLKQKVFANKRCPSGLVDVGMDIARSCGGLPLAIVLVAGILSAVNETRFAWLEVAKKLRSCVDGEDGHFEKVISLSYTHLPHHLRACFLCMGCFPEDYEIRVSKLIKLWIAEGFVEPRGGKKSLEECAEMILDDLMKRNLALVRRRKSNGKIKSCNVHDLVRDTELALTEFTLLRVLDLVEANFNLFPAPVLDLFQLRYLGFNSRGAMEIPAAINRLQNLRTLMICKSYSSNSTDAVRLPLEIWMMPLLTHLVSSVPLSLNLEGVASTLEELVTLSEVRRFTCSKKMMQMIPNIKKLGTTYFSNDAGDYELHNLVLLHQLEKLKLNGYGVSLKVNPVFPKTLKKLTLSGWRFPWKYMETVGSLPNLQVLKLRCYACDGHTWETKDEQFLSLEYLYIYFSDLENLVTESSHFPKLKRLVFIHCPRLSEIPDDIGDIPTLQLIEVDSKNTSLLKCARRIQEEQCEIGNYDLQVCCDNYHKISVIETFFNIKLYEISHSYLNNAEIKHMSHDDDEVFEKSGLLSLLCKISCPRLPLPFILRPEFFDTTNAMEAKEVKKNCVLQKREEKEWAYRKGQPAGLKNWHFRGVGRDGPPRRRAQPAGIRILVGRGEAARQGNGPNKLKSSLTPPPPPLFISFLNIAIFNVLFFFL